MASTITLYGVLCVVDSLGHVRKRRLGRLFSHGQYYDRGELGRLH